MKPGDPVDLKSHDQRVASDPMPVIHCNGIHTGLGTFLSLAYNESVACADVILSTCAHCESRTIFYTCSFFVLMSSDIYAHIFTFLLSLIQHKHAILYYRSLQTHTSCNYMQVHVTIN